MTETWLRPDIASLFMKGYVCFRSQFSSYDRPFGLGGGTLLFVRSSFSPVETFVQSLSENIFRDSTWCSLTISKNLSLLVDCVYRSPFSNFDNNQSQ